MPHAIQTAVVQHALDVADIYKQNACLKNALPEKPPRLVIDEIAAIDAPAGGATATGGVGAVVNTTGGLPKWMKTAATLGALALGGTGIGGAAAYGVLNGLSAWSGGSTGGGTTVTAPATSDRDGSLLQYLEDNGLHVPPEKRARQ